jgi:hypothetical protein
MSAHQLTNGNHPKVRAAGVAEKTNVPYGLTIAQAVFKSEY